jgi:hypothetical protein
MDPQLQQQPLAPTARLALQALAQASKPLSIEQIAIATGSTALTQARILQWLTHRGDVVRIPVGRRVFYTLPKLQATAQE